MAWCFDGAGSIIHSLRRRRNDEFIVCRYNITYVERMRYYYELRPGQSCACTRSGQSFNNTAPCTFAKHDTRIWFEFYYMATFRRDVNVFQAKIYVRVRKFANSRDSNNCFSRSQFRKHGVTPLG